VLLCELIGDIKVFIFLIDLGICFVLVRYQLNLRSTCLGLAELEEEEGSCLIVGPVFELICQ
jgi:hypothetical protein